jgi:hypothetical protein
MAQLHDPNNKILNQWLLTLCKVLSASLIFFFKAAFPPSGAGPFGIFLYLLTFSCFSVMVKSDMMSEDIDDNGDGDGNEGV